MVDGDRDLKEKVGALLPCLNERQRRALLEFAAASDEEVEEASEPSVLEKIKNIFAGKAGG